MSGEQSSVCFGWCFRRAQSTSVSSQKSVWTVRGCFVFPSKHERAKLLHILRQEVRKRAGVIVMNMKKFSYRKKCILWNFQKTRKMRFLVILSKLPVVYLIPMTVFICIVSATIKSATKVWTTRNGCLIEYCVLIYGCDENKQSNCRWPLLKIYSTETNPLVIESNLYEKRKKSTFYIFLAIFGSTSSLKN